MLFLFADDGSGGEEGVIPIKDDTSLLSDFGSRSVHMVHMIHRMRRMHVQK